MRTILICPSRRPGVERLAADMPLVTVPMCGQGLLHYWLAHLAQSGCKEATVLAADRPDQVRDAAGNGACWGLKIEVVACREEPTPAQTLAQYPTAAGQEPTQMWVLDHFPGQPELPLFETYSGWFAALLAWMPRAQTPDQVGWRELQPGVWAGLQARVSPRAELHAPCWIGRSAFIGPRAVVGPRSIIEDGAFVEADAEVTSSYIGPNTFVGRYAEIHESIAWGNLLVHMPLASAANISDRFLLCGLRRPARPDAGGWSSRFAGLRLWRQPTAVPPDPNSTPSRSA